MVSKGCCRLCLAPKTECVEIWSNFGADRQKLEFKILDCVHIKVSKDDHLSPMICHACISYLNSWQSFKNRCDAAEQKQREVCIEDQSRKKGHCHQSSDPSENIIKEEPFDVKNDNELDPSNFLMQGVNGGNDRLQNGSLSEGFTNEQQQLTGQDEFGYELFDQDGNSSSSLRNPQNCPVCDKQYNNYYNVLRHMESKHPNQLPQIYQCTRCSEGFPRQSELRDHLNSAHGETIAPVANTQRILYSCRQCSNTYNSIDGLQEHIKTHNQNSENEECNKKTNPCTTPMLSEATEEPSVSDQPVVSRTLNCGLCDFALTSIEALRQHMSEIHGMDKKFFYCNLCPAKFMNNRGLRFHLFRSHGVRDESIPMTSNQSSTSLLKPIQQVPSMTLQVPSINLDESGTKLNECKICHIVYKNIEQLSLHVQLVHPALDNKSPDGRKVRDPNDIWQPDQLPPSKMRRKQTANTAVQKSPPTCPHCLSTFASSNNLKRHIIEVHKLKPLLNSSVLKAKECGSVEMAEIVDAHVHGESTMNYNGSEHQEQDYIKEEQEEHFDSNAVVEDDFIGDTEENECSNDAGEQYFCELCQVHFTSANALRQHVSEHFLNGGIEGQMPLQKDDNHGTSTDSRSSTNSSESSSTSENES